MVKNSKILVAGGSISNTNGVQLAYSSNYAQMQLNGTTGSFIDFSDSSTDYKGRIIYTNSNNKFKFYTNATQALEIDSSQNATFAGNIVVDGTVDGVDIAARNSVLSSTATTADAALPKAGGTMEGALSLAADPTNDLHAATKQYVDEQVAAGGGGNSFTDINVAGNIIHTGNTCTPVVEL